MRVATFKSDERQHLGVGLEQAAEKLIDLTLASDLRRETRGAETFAAPRDAMSFIEAAAGTGLGRLQELVAQIAGDPALDNARADINRVKLSAPLTRPGKIICLAGNYREHIAESGFETPQLSDIFTPQLFIKPSTTLIGNGDDIVLGGQNVTVGWETELAVVIGKSAKDVAADEADEYVFGYTILNDLSERRLNSQIENRRLRENDRFFDWLAGKWFDGFAPCGPWIVTKDEIPDPHDLEIKLSVNGQLRQQGNTADMIFRIPELVAYISSIMTLEPGDIISTGTPAGAGLGGETSLKDGDELVCEIAGLGRLRNKVRCEN